MSCWPIISLKYAKHIAHEWHQVILNQKEHFCHKAEALSEALSKYLLQTKCGYTSSRNVHDPFQDHGAYLSCLGVSGEQPGHDPLNLTPSPIDNFETAVIKKKKEEALGQWGKKQGRTCELHREAQVNQEVQSQKRLAVKQRCSANHWMTVQNT